MLIAFETQTINYNALPLYTIAYIRTQLQRYSIQLIFMDTNHVTQMSWFVFPEHHDDNQLQEQLLFI